MAEQIAAHGHAVIGPVQRILFSLLVVLLGDGLVQQHKGDDHGSTRYFLKAVELMKERSSRRKGKVGS